MTNLQGFEAWLDAAFAALPAKNAHAFQSIWGRHLLSFKGSSVCDEIDEESAALIWSALQQDQRLLIVLPDALEHRRAILLATGLLYTWLNPKRDPVRVSRRQRIIYFGTYIGIREQLASVRLRNSLMKFSEAFPQYNLGRLGTAVGGNAATAAPAAQSSNTPEVVTVYAPAEPQLILDREQPDWIAIDVGDHGRVPWLSAILSHARERRIPVVAWGLNPLSDAVDTFKRGGALIHIWPLSIKLIPAANGSPPAQMETAIHPVSVAGKGVEGISGDLRAAVQELAGTNTRENSLGHAAVLAHWRFLRSAEALCVPVNFHEAEAQKLYGLRSFHYLQQSCKSFQRLCSVDHALIAKLELAESRIAAAIEAQRQSTAPLWEALTKLILEEPPAGARRYLAFSSRSRKQLFLFALLAYYNITESDLVEIGTVPVSYAELRNPETIDVDFPDPGHTSTAGPGSVVLIGVPSPLVTGNLLPCFSYTRLEVLIYQYQEVTLVRRVLLWASRCNPHPDYLRLSLRALSQSDPPEPVSVQRVSLRPGLHLEPSSGRKSAAPKMSDRDLLYGFDAEEELSKLFKESDDDDDGVIAPSDLDRGTDSRSDIEDWRKDAVYLSFELGWHGIFAPDDKLYVVVRSPEGLETEARYVSSLRVHDRVLLIYGERRQSFYDLLISRVHNHPTFALHAALVRRWQEEISQAFYEYRRRSGGSLTALHESLLAEGSTISYAAVRLWLNGETLCPDDAEDLRRLGAILEVPFVTSNYRRIHTAAKRLGGCHRALSRRLNSWLRAQAVNNESTAEQDVIDAELGITFDDFKNSLMLLRITDKRPMVEPVFRSKLGRLERS